MNCFVALNRSASRLEFSEALLAGATIDFLLSVFRDADAAKRLFRKALGDRSHPQPSRTALAAEVLFLRKQLAYYRDHQIRPRRRAKRHASPRTVRKYWPLQPDGTRQRRTSSQHWRTFLKNHAQGILTCDFLVAVTVRFQVLFVFLVMEVGSRRILHSNVTAHPTADWTRQQFREAIPSDRGYSS